jgi:alpha-galactosidase
MRKVKFSIIGAGSISFCPGTVTDILQNESFKQVDIEIYLMDIAQYALDLSYKYCLGLAERLGRKVNIQASTDLAKALSGADFVITAIEKERYHYWSQDFHIPRRYGFRQVYGENGGPGGMFHTLRNLPPMLKIARTMERECPDAWLLNYTNPEAKLVEAIYDLTKIKAVGICHGEVMGAYPLSLFLQMPMSRIGYTCVGLNHFGWYTRIWDKKTGEDLYPKLREGERNGSPLAHWDEYSLMRIMLRTYGLLPYPGGNHIGEYIAWSDGFVASVLPQFYFDPVADDPWGTRKPPEFVYSIDYNPTGHLPFPDKKKNKKEPVEAELAKGEYEKAFDPNKEIEGSGEYGIPIAEAIFFDKPTEFAALNIPNDGCAKDLPLGMVIEIGAKVDGKGIHTLPCDPLPKAVAQMIATQGTIHKLVIEAYVEKSRNKLLQAILLDPTVSSYHNAVCVINELCELQKEELPELHW